MLIGVSLIVAPLLSIVQEIVVPEEGDGVDLLAVVAADPARYEAARFLGLVTALVFIPAFLGIFHLLRGSAGVLAHVGVTLALIGAVGFAADNAAGFVNLEMVSAGAERSEMAELRERTEDSPGLTVVTILGFGGLLLGLLFLSIALWRSRTVSRWIPGLILAFFVLDMFTAGIAKGLDVGVHALLAIGLGGIGWHILRMSNSDWEGAGPSHVPLE